MLHGFSLSYELLARAGEYGLPCPASGYVRAFDQQTVPIVWRECRRDEQVQLRGFVSEDLRLQNLYPFGFILCITLLSLRDEENFVLLQIELEVPSGVI